MKRASVTVVTRHSSNIVNPESQRNETGIIIVEERRESRPRLRSRLTTSLESILLPGNRDPSDM